MASFFPVYMGWIGLFFLAGAVFTGLTAYLYHEEIGIEEEDGGNHNHHRTDTLCSQRADLLQTEEVDMAETTELCASGAYASGVHLSPAGK